MIDNFSKTLSVKDRRGEDHNFSFPLREGETRACFFNFVFLLLLFLMLRGSCHLRMVDDIGEKSND